MKLFNLMRFVVLAGMFLVGGQAWAVCTATECDLTAGQTNVVGKVTITNDADSLQVTYTLTDGTFTEELQMWAGDNLLNVPGNTVGNPPKFIPVPGQFCQSDGGACSGTTDYPASAIGQTSYTFDIPLDQLSIADTTNVCGLKLYVFTHGSVEWSGGTDTVWGGCIGVNISEPGRWYYYTEYTWCCDDNEPPPVTVCQTAYAKGGYVWTTDKKSNPEKLPSLNLTKNRWGWAINLTTTGTTTYDIWAGAGLNKTGNGKKVGTLTVNWDGTNATVTYNLDSGNTLEEVHVYAGDGSPTTIAPGQYTHINEFDPNVNHYTVTLPLADTDGTAGVWLVAHAVVCYEEVVPQ